MKERFGKHGELRRVHNLMRLPEPANHAELRLNPNNRESDAQALRLTICLGLMKNQISMRPLWQPKSDLLSVIQNKVF